MTSIEPVSSAFSNIPLFLQTKSYDRVRNKLNISSIAPTTREKMESLNQFPSFNTASDQLAQIEKWAAADWSCVTLQSQNWEETVRVCPETFEFAPLEVKQNLDLATLAIHGSPAMIRFVDKSLLNSENLNRFAQQSPQVTLFLEESEREQMNPDRLTDLAKDPRTLTSPLELEHIRSLVDKCLSTWSTFLNSKPRFPSSLLLKRNSSIHSPHTLQVFKDGRVWVHIHNGKFAQGSAKKAKLVYDVT